MRMQSRLWPRAISRLAARALLLHALRVGLLILILMLIREQHHRWTTRLRAASEPTYSLDDVRHLFPDAAGLSPGDAADGSQLVLDANGLTLGYVVQTSPAADTIVGFSGPSNCLVGVDTEDNVRGVRLLTSGDTPEHVAIIGSSEHFFPAFADRPRTELTERPAVDAVSGATLTSLAIVDSVVLRLGGQRRSLRFPNPLNLTEVQSVFPDAATLTAEPRRDGVWVVSDSRGKVVGRAVRTTPLADTVIGFQGPQDAVIYLDPADIVVTTRLRSSFDNQPYVGWVQDEEYFLDLFAGRAWAELGEIDLDSEQVEGVSGATMTSQGMAAAVVATARTQPIIRWPPESDAGPAMQKTHWWQGWSRATVAHWIRTVASVSARDWGTVAITLLGLAIGFRWVRVRGWSRGLYHAVLITYLGFMNGDLVSQAILVGWARSGIPWQRAPGLVFLTAAAFLVPVCSRRQTYCQHLCPHGALQQQLMRLGWRVTLPRSLQVVLRTIPLVLLLWVVYVAMTHKPYSLVDIEPFDAYVFRVAGWATIGVFILGLIVSTFVPMGYCRYGCPTGAVLGLIRFHGRSDRVQARDLAAILCLAVALGLFLSFD